MCVNTLPNEVRIEVRIVCKYSCADFDGKQFMGIWILTQIITSWMLLRTERPEKSQIERDKIVRHGTNIQDGMVICRNTNVCWWEHTIANMPLFSSEGWQVDCDKLILLKHNIGFETGYFRWILHPSKIAEKKCLSFENYATNFQMRNEFPKICT